MLRFPVFRRALLAWVGLGILVCTVNGTSGSPSLAPSSRKALTGKPWLDMDYGPFLTASIEAPEPRTNLAYKGIAIRLPQDPSAAVVFDTDLLRYAAGWTGNFVALKGVVYDGEHWAYPAIDGTQVFGNAMLPGWDYQGAFVDPRPEPYGPLPRTWAHWKGLYRYSNHVVLAYTVGTMSVLEAPGLEQAKGATAFARTFNCGNSPVAHTLQVAFEPNTTPEVVPVSPISPVTTAETTCAILVLRPPATPPNRKPSDDALMGKWDFDGDPEPAKDHSALRLKQLGTSASQGRSGKGLAFDGNARVEMVPREAINFLAHDYTLSAWVQTAKDGTICAQSPREGNWVPDGKTFFLRGGRLAFDIGWVGVVSGRRPITDGRWHHVAFTWSHSTARVTLYVDGTVDGSGTLRPRNEVPEHILQLGYTSKNFPAAPWFSGAMDELHLYRRALPPEEIAALAGTVSQQTVVAAACVGVPNGSRWLTNVPGHARLHLPAANRPFRFRVLIWRGSPEQLGAFAQLVQTAAPAESLEAFTLGGPRLWDDTLVTRGQLGTNEGPYAIDTLTAPEANPWHAWFRFGGVDLFPDGRRAALCTWNGDVWLVDGIDGDLNPLRWRRFAAGLFQPLGLKVVDQTVYVLGRDQMTRLHDLNRDGEADWYENFNNDCLVSEHFHEFATDLKTDAAGNFYYIKCARHALPAAHAHHGTLFKVSPDGQRSEIVARGFRAVNGLGIGPGGEITCVDNQGHWMPGNRINWVKPGGWYGNQWAANPERRTSYDPPLCWMHNFVDRSGGTHLWVPTADWGPLQGELITLSYGMGQMFLVLKEEINGVMQGGVTRFPLEFETGIMRGVFHPHNHQLYAAGLYGWAGNKTKPGEFYRIRHTGKPVHLVTRLQAVQDGVLLGFSQPLAVDSATDSGNFDVQVWNYRWTEQYGSPEFKPDGQEGRARLRIEAATLSADQRVVFLSIPSLQPVMQMHITFNLRAADGARVQNFVHNTIHSLRPVPGLGLLGPGTFARTVEPPPTTEVRAPGLVQTLVADANPALTDTRRVRLPALYVAANAPPSAFLPPSRFRSTWQGFLNLDLNEEITFSAEGRGKLDLQLNGQAVLAGSVEQPGHRSQPITLRAGANPFALTYRSPAQGEAELRLFWSSKTRTREPIPATTFSHDPSQPELITGEERRAGRHWMAALLCTKCHEADVTWPPQAMPELLADAPGLDGIGGRVQLSWLATYLANPHAAREEVRMPQVLQGSPDQVATDARDVALFLSTLTPGELETPTAPTNAEAAGEEGAALFKRLGCVACHRLSGEAAQANDSRIGLDHVPAKWKPNALAAFLQAPSRFYPATRMPDYQLTPTEASSLASFLQSQSQSEVPAAQPRGDVARGRDLVRQSGCLNCHQVRGLTNEAFFPRLASLPSGDWRRGCLAETDIARGRAPAYHLTAEQRRVLRAFAKTSLLRSLQQDTPAELLARQYSDLRCHACHARDFTTDLWSSLTSASTSGQAANPYEDSEPASGTASVHLGRPALTFAGEKLQPDWLARFLSGSLPYKPRPESQGRMPLFRFYGEHLARGIVHEHGFSSEPERAAEVDQKLVALGEKLTRFEGGFGCLACHDVGTRKALAGADTATINFAFITDRLRPGYYWRYVLDPQRFRPGTMMPTFIAEDGSTPLKGVFGGDAQQQFAAIWQYLLSIQTTNALAPAVHSNR